jgi:hypothetical protein
VRWRQQQERIDVASRGAARPPVQAGRRAAAVPGLEDAEHRATHDGGAGPDGRRHRLVGRPQSVGVLDGHDPAAGEPPREHDHTQAGGEHRGAGDGLQVDSPVPRAVPVRGLLERSDHGRDGKAER